MENKATRKVPKKAFREALEAGVLGEVGVPVVGPPTLPFSQ